MEQRTNWLPWAIGGCGCLLILGLMAGGGAYYWFEMREPIVETIEYPTPPPAPIPTPTPTPGSDPNGTPPPALPSGQPPRLLSATVTEVTGTSPVQVGALCGFAIEQHERENEPPWCRSQVSCGTTILYGAGANNGYYNCTLSANPSRATGEDGGTTGQDSDPAISFDTQAGTLTITDDAQGQFGAFSITARLSVVN